MAFEATYGWGWFADLLEDVGIPAHMAHPRANKAIASARVKNDAVDAKTLAQLLRTGLLPESWIAPPEIRERRRLVRMRTSLVRIRSRLKNQVHAVLADRGLHPEGTDIFARDVGLLSQRLPTVTLQRLEANLRLIEELDEEVDLADEQIHKQFARDPGVRRLQPLPGIGIITGAIVVAELGEIQRFPSARHFCSWAGLTPTEHSSAEHTRRGHISKQGSRWLRWVLVEAACVANRNPPFGQVLRSSRQPPRRQDRPGCPGPQAGHPLLPRPAQPAGLPGLSGSAPMTLIALRSERTRPNSWPPLTAAV